jgi:methionyl-tRNA formyltransferase
MKILFLGFPDYLSNLLLQLKGKSFLIENDIDIMFAETSVSQKIFNFKTIKEFKNKSLTKIAAKFITSLNLNSSKRNINTLFPKVDISFLDNYYNVKFINYLGLDNIKRLEEYNFMIVATFGEKIPAKIFNAPKGRTLNIHPSYLPQLRGGYPTYVEAYEANSYSGTTIHYMEDKWDNGAIITQKRYKVDRQMNNNDRFLLSTKHAACLLNNLHKNKYDITHLNQDLNHVSYCHKVVKPKTELNLLNKDDNIEGFVRANYAKHLYPFTYLFYNLNLFSIIEIQKILDVSRIPVKFININSLNIFRIKNYFFLNFYGQIYKVNKYIFKGEIVSN